MPVELDTLLVGSHLQSLEPVYLEPDLFVRCVTRAVDASGVRGYARTSQPVRLTKKYGSCMDEEEEVFNVSLSSYELFSGSSEVSLRVCVCWHGWWSMFSYIFTRH